MIGYQEGCWNRGHELRSLDDGCDDWGLGYGHDDGCLRFGDEEGSDEDALDDWSGCLGYKDGLDDWCLDLGDE